MSDKKTILIIDDEKDILTYLSAFFKENNFDVLTAANGKEGIQIAENEIPSLITLDISMPEESGVKALRALQTNDKTKNIPIIIVTGIASDFKRFINDRKQVRMPEGYFEKPVDKNLLLEKVKELLEV